MKQRFSRTRTSHHPFWKRLLAGVFLLLLPSPVLAAFNPNLLLLDTDLTDGNSMSRAGIQDFLNRKTSGIASMKFDGLNGKKTAAEIIYEAGKFWGISQKYLLVRLQVEQGLVTATSPTQRQLDAATGYGCPDNSSCDPSYKGFFNQVNWAARAIRGEKYLAGIEKRGYTISGWGPSITKTTGDGIAVTPVNAATAVLYTYTPWVGKYGGGRQDVGGSSLIWKKFNDWFFRQFPEGALLRQAGTDTYFRIEGGKKRPYRSLNVLVTSQDPRKALLASSSELEAYETGTPIVFGEFSLIRSPRGTVFLIVDGKKRGIASREVFRTLGFNPEEVLLASWDDINTFPDGETIDLGSAYPAGALLRSAENGGIAYVENGTRSPIFAQEILTSRFKRRPIITVHQDELDQYVQSDPVLFRDGELVTAEGDRSVYFISNGERRPIASREAFDRLGFQWTNVIKTNLRALELHPLGEALIFEEPTEE